MFLDNKDVREIELENELHSMVLGDRFIVKYCQKINIVAELLANIGSLIPDKTLVIHFFNGLGPNCDNITTPIRHHEPF